MEVIYIKLLRIDILVINIIYVRALATQTDNYINLHNIAVDTC